MTGGDLVTLWFSAYWKRIAAVVLILFGVGFAGGVVYVRKYNSWLTQNSINEQVLSDQKIKLRNENEELQGRVLVLEKELSRSKLVNDELDRTNIRLQAQIEIETELRRKNCGGK